MGRRDRDQPGLHQPASPSSRAQALTSYPLLALSILVAGYGLWRARAAPEFLGAAIVLTLWVMADVIMTAATLAPRLLVARIVYAVTFAALPGFTAALLANGRLRALPILIGLAYGTALVVLRHHPLVAERWLRCLQASRVVVFGWSVWVFLRQPSDPSRDPGRPIGILMAWTDGISVALGLWVPWWQGQVASAACWAGVAGLLWLAG